MKLRTDDRSSDPGSSAPGGCTHTKVDEIHVAQCVVQESYKTAKVADRLLAIGEVWCRL